MSQSTQELFDEESSQVSPESNMSLKFYTEFYEAVEALDEGISDHLLQWVETGIALSLSLLVLSVCKYYECSLLPALFPLMLFELRTIYLSSSQLKRNTDHFFYRNNKKNELLEAVGSLLFYSLQVLYWVFPLVYFTFTLFPLLAAVLLRLFLSNAVSHECESFSNMVTPTQMLFLGRWVKLLAFLSVGLHIDSFVECSLAVALWPLWVALLVVGLAGIGLLLLSFSAFFSFLVKEAELYEVLASCWLTFSASGLSLTLSYFLYCFAVDSYTFATPLVPVGFLAVQVSLTLWARTPLVKWWDQFFLPENPCSVSQAQAPISLSSLAAAIKKPTQLLMRHSSTYFSPMGNQERPSRKQRTHSVMQEIVKTRAHKRFVSVRESHPASQFISAEFVREGLCSSCCTGPCNSVIMDCGHGGLCFACCLKQWELSQMCYMCRAPIREVLQVAHNSHTTVRVICRTRRAGT